MTGFHHEALLYADQDAFLAGTVPFLEEGLRGGERMLVALGADRIAALMAALERGADCVRFADMAHVGANPARIIPIWRDFVAGREDDAPARTIGEPIWAGRSAAELVECQRHEALLNLAFATTPDFRLLCPYDTAALPAAVIAEARRSHPHVTVGHNRAPSAAYPGLPAITEPFASPLPAPPQTAERYGFDAHGLPCLREVVAAHATLAGLTPPARPRPRVRGQRGHHQQRAARGRPRGPAAVDRGPVRGLRRTRRRSDRRAPGRARAAQPRARRRLGAVAGQPALRAGPGALLRGRQRRARAHGTAVIQSGRRPTTLQNERDPGGSVRGRAVNEEGSRVPTGCPRRRPRV